MFRDAIAQYQQAIIKWLHQASEFFDQKPPADLSIPFPDKPEVILPEPPKQSPNSKQSGGTAPVALATGLGWILGDPVGVAVVGGGTYLFNQTTTEPEQPKSSASYLEEVSQACIEVAQNYLTCFSTQACSMLQQYQEIAEKIINSDVSEKPLKLTTQHHQLQLLQMLWDNLNQELELVKTKLAD